MKITEKIFDASTNEESMLEREETSKEKEQRIENDKARIKFLTENKAKQDARDSAIKKLGEIAGLTEEELASIL
jgi:hypothetical protein